MKRLCPQTDYQAQVQVTPNERAEIAEALWSHILHRNRNRSDDLLGRSIFVRPGQARAHAKDPTLLPMDVGDVDHCIWSYGCDLLQSSITQVRSFSNAALHPTAGDHFVHNPRVSSKH